MRYQLCRCWHRETCPRLGSRVYLRGDFFHSLELRCPGEVALSTTLPKSRNLSVIGAWPHSPLSTLCMMHTSYNPLMRGAMNCAASLASFPTVHQPLSSISMHSLHSLHLFLVWLLLRYYSSSTMGIRGYGPFLLTASTLKIIPTSCGIESSFIYGATYTLPSLS